MNQLFRSSSSVYIKRRAFEYMVSGLCAMDRSREVEDLVEDLRGNGGAIDPSAFELKSIIHGEHIEMVSWLKKMRSSDMSFNSSIDNGNLSAGDVAEKKKKESREKERE
ncbi:Pentatricopeptide repeat-containing protein [Arachis hypogaea]|nr:Pentatricopeptide repeat-containing protein [Arachis hypogaea]